MLQWGSYILPNNVLISLLFNKYLTSLRLTTSPLKDIVRDFLSLKYVWLHLSKTHDLEIVIQANCFTDLPPLKTKKAI